MDSNAFELSDLVPMVALHPRSETERLLAIRRQILAGTYLNDEKLELAIERVVKALQAEPVARRVESRRSRRKWA